MSRGPGRIERAIRELFDAHPDFAFVTDELVEHCYSDVRPIERKHQVAVLRAAWKVIDADPDWSAYRTKGQGQGWVFANRANLQSWALGRMIMGGVFGSDFIYRSEKRTRRASWWWKPTTREDLLEKLKPESDSRYLEQIQPGGFWAKEVERHRARRAGDVERADTLDCELEYEVAQSWGQLGVDPREVGVDMDKVKRFAARNVIGRETHIEPEPPPPADPIADLADKARALITQNDPDAVRAGLAEIADALDAMRLPRAA
jgi:hypothetical protein